MTDHSRHEHAELREWAGAFALGSLDPDDRRRFERHLNACERCADEVNAYAPIPGLLAHIELDDLHGASPETADTISRRAVDEGLAAQSSRNRWRAAAIGIAAAVLLVVSAATVIRIVDDAPSRPVVSATVTSSQAGSSEIATSERTWGTEITVRADGLPDRSEYQLWGVDQNGTWSIAATWGPTPTGRANITGATSLPTASLERIVVTSEDRSDILIDSTV
jgi:anti-sigma-K factor RskA